MGVSSIFSYIRCFAQASLLCAVCVTGISRSHSQQAVFTAPLDIPLSVVGTFGELRPDHFHTGIDFSTKGVTGKNVIAIADGHISRIKVSASGYGKAVYIDHPGGYTSVYGHLEAFSVVVDDYIRRRQYEQQSFEIDIEPDEELFKVRKGDIIGYSGNSGSSQGPHLHFEIRNTRTEHPLNPMLFGIAAADMKAPVIRKLRIYPAGAQSFVNGSNASIDFGLTKKDSVFVLSSKDTISISGSVYFGIDAEDVQNGSSETGLYCEAFYVDDRCIFSWKMDSLDFSQARYINTFIDFTTYRDLGTRYVCTRIQPGNRLRLYNSIDNNGTISFSDTLVHYIRIVTADYSGNSSSVVFKMKRNDLLPVRKNPEKEPVNVFYYGLHNTFKSDDIKVELPPDALYDSVIFKCEPKTKIPGAYSQTYAVLDKYTPVHSYVIIGMRPDKDISAILADKIVMVCIDRQVKSATKGYWEEGLYMARVRRFGDYTLLADTVPPVIKPLNFSDKKNVSKQEKLNVKITDDLSGISRYDAYLNGQWILMEFDKKNDMLTYTRDEKAISGNNEFKLEVSDLCGNKAVLKIMLRY